MPQLPVNIDSSYSDDGSPARKAHQQHHDVLHAFNNDWDGIAPADYVPVPEGIEAGEVPTWDGAEWVPGTGGAPAAPLTLTAPVAANVPLTLMGAASQTGDLLKLQDSGSVDLLRISPTGRQLIGASAMLGVTTGVVDAMLVVNQPDPAIQTQIWRGSPRGDGFAYTARISDGAHFTTNGAITSNGATALLAQPVREGQSPPAQYMIAAGVDIGPAINNAAFVSDTVNSVDHFAGFVQGGGLYPYFKIGYDGTLKWSEGSVTTFDCSVARSGVAGSGVLDFRTGGAERLRIDNNGRVGIGTQFPVTGRLVVDDDAVPIRLRSVPNRYRVDFGVDSGGLGITSYDDTGAAYMPFTFRGSMVIMSVGFAEKARLNTNGDFGLGTNDPQSGLHVVTRSQFWPAIRAQGATSQSDPILVVENSAAAHLWSVTAAGLPRWDAAANQQTTVGAAGGASALPATPTKYLKIVDSAGTTLVIPAYATS